MNKRNRERLSNVNINTSKPPSYADKGLEPPVQSKRALLKTIVCAICGKGGRTLVKDGDGYRHTDCVK